jgi:hypothetical protein
MLEILVREPEGKRPHGNPRHRWAGNTRVGTLIMATLL